ncbi:hypothetical protein RIF29_03579 [Crotalaria pallida]|uniref:Uncharacterized protein n=1 Tax=Crotalaria pallida TaxID=3830 RepID=A0AAN9J0B5_CROPI
MRDVVLLLYHVYLNFLRSMCILRTVCASSFWFCYINFLIFIFAYSFFIHLFIFRFFSRYLLVKFSSSLSLVHVEANLNE